MPQAVSPRHLRHDIRYRMQVLEIIQNRSWTEGGITKYNHKIFFVNSNAERIETEYVINQQYQDKFQVGDFVCFKVTRDNNTCSEIVPLIGCDQQTEKQPLFNNIGSINGEIYTVAAGLATQLMSTRMTISGYLPTIEDMMVDWAQVAQEIEDHLFNKAVQKIIGD